MGAGPDQTDTVGTETQERHSVCCQVLELTRHAPIRMNPAKLPPLTVMQEKRVKLFREYFKGIGQVSVMRKGQKPGYMLIVVIANGEVRYHQYDSAGELVDHWIQEPFFIDAPDVVPEPISAIKLNMENE